MEAFLGGLVLFGLILMGRELVAWYFKTNIIINELKKLNKK